MFILSVHQTHATKNGSAGAGHEAACARVAARFGERWLRIYALRKLRSDPVFPAAFELFAGSDQPLVDVGCGVGLLAFYLRERNFRPPINGLDTDRRKVERANAVASGVYHDLQFIEQDACDPIAATGNIVLFDLLHYLRPEDQSRLLDRLAPRVAPGGMLVIRDCPRDDNWRYWLTYLGERFAQGTTWNMKAALHFPTREKVFAAFEEDEFSRAVEPLWGRTPFNNHLFIFRRHAVANVPL
ncbi:MAG: class I SAM-dependent methyltransferase [Verrucomicrobiota bacterium]|nr:class I SAM-dependent methyltransferase [Verrucomicrobiota bacterium]